MSARYEIADHGSKLHVRDTKYGSEVSMLRVKSYSRELTVMAGAIRQQSADIAALKDALADEVNANEAFRKAGSARDDEDMPTFCARLIAERDKYRGQLFDCELALKMEHDLLREKRAELAAAVAENAALLAANRDCILHFDAMKLRAEQAEALLSAIDSAPVVAVVREMKRDFASGPYKFIYYDSDNLPAGCAELIAKPAKD